MIEALLLTMIHEGPRVIADPHHYEARANIMWAGMMAHNNSCGDGRTGSISGFVTLDEEDCERIYRMML